VLLQPEPVAETVFLRAGDPRTARFRSVALRGAAGAGAGACACSAPPPELLRSVWLAQPASIALINNINSRLVLGRISGSPDHAGQGLCIIAHSQAA